MHLLATNKKWNNRPEVAQDLRETIVNHSICHMSHQSVSRARAPDGSLLANTCTTIKEKRRRSCGITVLTAQEAGSLPEDLYHLHATVTTGMPAQQARTGSKQQ